MKITDVQGKQVKIHNELTVSFIPYDFEGKLTDVVGCKTTGYRGLIRDLEDKIVAVAFKYKSEEDWIMF